MLNPKLILSAFISLSILAASCNRRPLIPKDNNIEAERNNHLFVFVGEKIEVKEVPSKESSFDGEYYARYKVLQRVYGEYDGDFIEFTAYSHRGFPEFGNYKNSLLFVSKEGDSFFHEKYQFYDVYPTKNKRWAGRYSVLDFGREGKERNGVKPEIIDFEPEVSFPFSKMENQKEIDCWFPQPFYKLDSIKATAVYGNYIEDLFIIEKKGVLAHRGLFAPRPSEDLISTSEYPTAEIIVEDKAEYKRFEKFLDSLSDLTDKSKRTTTFAFALDTILIDNKPAVQQDLFERGIFDDSLMLKLRKADNTHVSIVLSDSVVTNAYHKKVAKKIDGNFVARLKLIKEASGNKELIVDLEFVKTKGVYKLYSCNQSNRSICWQ